MMSKILKSGIIVGLFVLVVLVPSFASAALVQTEANPGNAAAGESGALIASSALITVVAMTNAGAPLGQLGASVGNGTAEITLPAGWVLSTVTVPPGGCLMTTTQFTNQGNGVYTIRVVPAVANPACTWLSGEYHFVVRINVLVGAVRQQGSGLGVLQIP